MEGNPQFSPKSLENVEPLKKDHYYYVNNELEGRPVIFECDADSIAEADAKFEENFNIKLVEANHIGCSFVNNKKK